jgi:hypothetical protein
VTKEGVYAGDLKVGDIVRVRTAIWRVSRVAPCGPDEVEVVFVKPDESDQLVLNMHPGQILERLVSTQQQPGVRNRQTSRADRS